MFSRRATRLAPTNIKVFIVNVETTCSLCGKSFLKERKYVNRNTGLHNKSYCSIQCNKNARTTSIITNCNGCGKSISVTPAECKKRSKHYCSKSCAASVNNIGNHRNFKDKSYRKKAFAYYEPQCSVCGYDVVLHLIIHHKDKNRNNNEISNLDILCTKHHAAIHIEMRAMTRARSRMKGESELGFSVQ